MNKYKIIAIDLDDTLFDDNKNISKENIETIKEVKKQGIKIVISSGRSPMGIQDTLEALDLLNDDTYIIAFNGASIYHLPDFKLVYSKSLTGKDVKEIYKYLPDGLYAHFYDIDLKLYANQRNEYTTGGAVLNHIDYEIVDFNKLDDDYRIIKLLYTGNPNLITETIQKVTPIFSDKHALMRSAPIYYEFLPKNISKGKALKEIAKLENISMEEVMAFGDNQNDLEMIEMAGMGVAMQNSLDPNILKKANFVTKTNNESGVAYAIKELILKK